jgi:hypothetical protein
MITLRSAFTVGLTLILLSGVAGAATERVSIVRSCEAAIISSNRLLEVVDSLPTGKSDRERVRLADDYRKKFAREYSASNDRQLRKMKSLKEERLSKLEKALRRRGLEFSKFRIVRELPAETALGVKLELYAVLNDGDEAYIGKLYYQAYGERAEIVSFSIKVEHIYQNLGVSTILAAAAIEDNPQTEELESLLKDMNIAKFRRGIQMGLSPLAALNETPALKLRRSLGYEIDLSRTSIPRNADAPYVEVIAVRADLARR